MKKKILRTIIVFVVVFVAIHGIYLNTFRHFILLPNFM